MPLAYCTIAPGAGQALRQPGSAQCMQPSLRISHSSLPSGSTSKKRITVQELGGEVARVVVDAVVVADLVAQVVPLHARDLAGLAADALGDVDQLGDLRRLPRTLGGGVVVAERRCDVQGLQCHGVLLGLLDVDEERLELRRLGVGVADEGRQRVGEVARSASRP